MVHVDMYRLLDHAAADLLAEFDSLDLDTDLADAVVVVEWGEGLAERLSDSHLDVRLCVRTTTPRCARPTGSGKPVIVLAIDTATPAVTAVWFVGTTTASKCSPSGSPSTRVRMPSRSRRMWLRRLLMQGWRG